MDYETIILEKKEHIATITLNRPDRLNALTFQMADELKDAAINVDADDEVRVVVITGAGRAFSSGADLKADRSEKPKFGQGLADRLFDAVFNIEKPVIASINGFSIGGGCTMTLCCDIRIASEEAKFQLPFARLSICTELGSSYLLHRLIGLAKAAELIFTAKMIDATEAKDIGLVNQVVPANKLADATQEMAATIAKFPPLSVQMNKRALRSGLNGGLPGQLEYESLAGGYLSATEDHKEAVKAFIEKREPVFKGR